VGSALEAKRNWPMMVGGMDYLVLRDARFSAVKFIGSFELGNSGRIDEFSPDGNGYYLVCADGSERELCIKKAASQKVTLHRCKSTVALSSGSSGRKTPGCFFI